MTTQGAQLGEEYHPPLQLQPCNPSCTLSGKAPRLQHAELCQHPPARARSAGCRAPQPPPPGIQPACGCCHSLHHARQFASTRARPSPAPAASAMRAHRRRDLAQGRSRQASRADAAPSRIRLRLKWCSNSSCTTTTTVRACLARALTPAATAARTLTCARPKPRAGTWGRSTARRGTARTATLRGRRTRRTPRRRRPHPRRPGLARWCAAARGHSRGRSSETGMRQKPYRYCLLCVQCATNHAGATIYCPAALACGDPHRAPLPLDENLLQLTATLRTQHANLSMRRSACRPQIELRERRAPAQHLLRPP
jgi:hypothetical protein